jgi:cell division protein FtsI (penicillin-binding protein 3)
VAVSAIANGGELLVPRLVLSVEDGLGQVVSEPGRQVRHRVFSEATAARLREMMVAVTAPGGTGTRAAVPGYSVAGKTGTSQKFDPQRRRYLDGRYVVSFVGFLPADDPKLVAVVVIDDPAPEAVLGPVYGGTVAAPVFRRIALRAAECLGIAPGEGLEFAGSAR